MSANVTHVVKRRNRLNAGGAFGLGTTTPSYAWDFVNNKARFASVDKGALANTPGWTFTRASTGYAQNAAGVLLPFASGELRRTDKGVLIEGARTNKCTNYNAVIPALVAMTTPAAFASAMTNIGASGPAGSLFGVVDDTSEIIAAGLASAVTSGRVIKVDNSAGATEAYLTFGGTTTNTNTHTYSLYLRGSGLVRYGDNAGFGGTFTMPTGFTRYSKTQAAGGASSVLGVGVAAGAVAYVILNQLEEASFVSSPIVVAGASATRAADVLTVPVSGIDYPISLFAEFERAVLTASVGGIIETYAAGGNRFVLTLSGAAETIQQYNNSGNVDQVNNTIAGAIGVGAVTKVAARTSTNDTMLVKNGTLGTKDSSCTNPAAPTAVWLGSQVAGGGPSFSYLRKAALWTRALTDSELQTVTL